MMMSRILLLLSVLLLSGCNSGIATVFGSSDSSDANSQAVVTAMQVMDARESPATLRFTLIDQEGDSPTIEFLYQRAGGRLEAITSGSAAGAQTFSASTAGDQHEVQWNFAREPGFDPDGLNADVVVLARLVGTEPSLIEGANSETVDLGNDPPVIESLEVPSEIVSGIVLIEFVANDSSSELIDFLIEFDIQGDVPDLGWRAARPAGESLTPRMTVQDLLVSSSGTSGQFFWDTDADLMAGNAEVILRVTPQDATESGAAFISQAFSINNNTPALVFLSEFTLANSNDRKHGVPIPYQVFDNEGDFVVPIVQWSRVAGQFPTLPSTNGEIVQVLSDPELRRTAQIIKEVDRVTEGSLVTLGGERVRLPRLQDEFSDLLGGGLANQNLQILRPAGRLTSVSADWAGVSLISPVDAACSRDGSSYYVLDEINPGAWSLIAVDALTGAGVQLASGMGTPVSLGVDRDRALVAVQSGADWTLTTVDIVAASEIVTGSGPGILRDVALRNARLAFASVDDKLVRIGLTDDGPEVMTIVSGLSDPAGVVLDPFSGEFAYVAEHGANRVVRVDLEHRLVSEVLASDAVGGVAFPSPAALAITENRQRLLVVCDTGGGSEMRGLSLGLEAAPAAAAGLPIANSIVELGSAASLATGPNGLTLCADAGDVLAMGGIEFEGSIARREGASNALELESALSLGSGVERRCRISVPTQLVRGSTGGTNGAVFWDSSEIRAGGEIYLRITGFDGVSLGAGDEANFPITLGGFPAHSAISLGAIGIPTAADLDGDGDQDVVIGQSGAAVVAFQGPKGVFTPAATTVNFAGMSEDDLALAVIATDLDEDGRPDLVAPGVNGIQIAFQNVDGTFPTDPVTIDATAMLQQGRQVVAADLNEDGAVDLASFHSDGSGANSHSVVLYSYAGGQSWVVSDEFEFSSIEGLGLHVLDADGDGDLDLATSGSSYLQQVTPGVFQVSVDPLFMLEPVPGTSSANNKWRSFLPVDLGEDGTRDLLVHQAWHFFFAGPGGGSSPLGFSSLGFFEEAELGGFEVRDPFVQLACDDQGSEVVTMAQLRRADLEGDGRMEAVGFDPEGLDIDFGFFTGGSRQLRIARPDERSETWTQDCIPIPTARGVFHPLPVLDMDGNGSTDLLQRDEAGVAHRFEFDVRGTDLAFQGSSENHSALSSSFLRGWHVRARDIDRDGDLDLILVRTSFTSPGGSTVTVLRQDSPRIFSEAQVLSGSVGFTNTGATTAELFDMNGDGELDLVTGATNTAVDFFGSFGFSLGTGGMAWFRGGDSGSFDEGVELDSDRPFQSYTEITNVDGTWQIGGTGGTAVADIDLDGKPDLAFMCGGRQVKPGDEPEEQKQVHIILSEEGAGPSIARSIGVPLVYDSATQRVTMHGLAIADVDGNGLPDIVTGNLGTEGSAPSDPASDEPVMVLYQDPALVFTPTVQSGLHGSSVGAIVARDLNEDGLCDIAWTELNLSEFAVIALQQEDGSFETQRFPMGGSTPIRNVVTGLEVVDLDLNGLLDVFVLNMGPNPKLLSQVSPGVFEPSEPVGPDGVSGTPGAIGGCVADLDGDGSLDFVRVSRDGSVVIDKIFPFTIHWGGER